MCLLTLPFLVAHLCSVNRVLRFLPVSPMEVACQSQHLILYAAPCLSLFVFVLDISKYVVVVKWLLLCVGNTNILRL